ncbi:Cytochrome c oxidase subunit 5A [Ceratobasidium sp. 392]|nr:Cytochrome c oxidase subunit 5A [Ceratobasidium sp. 392]
MSDSPEKTTGLRDLHGRQLNSLNKEYMLPADAPEMQRLNTQHRMLLLALGGLYPDNYSEQIRQKLKDKEDEVVEIVDLGSGSGDWYVVSAASHMMDLTPRTSGFLLRISEMAKEFPHSRAAGVDLAPSIPNGVAPNVRFETMDVTKGLSAYNDRCDMVQARCIANGIDDYPVFIAAMSRMLKPAGILMLMEGHLQVYDEEFNVIQPTSGGIPKLLSEIATASTSRALFAVRAASTASGAPPIRSSNSAVPLANVEAQWNGLTPEEQVEVHRELEELQKRDWKTLSIDEKKAAYFVAFGPHGPRTPVSPEGQTTKVITGTLALIGVAAAAYGVIRSYGGATPKTFTKEYQEAMNERAKEQKMNPITGITSEGYKGTGFVVSK